MKNTAFHNRRRYVHALAAVLSASATVFSFPAVAHASVGTPATVPVQTQRRNIIFILLDDLRFDGMGFLQPGLHTPNIDALARGGTYFPNTVVTSSLCSPSRATILTGETARNHGVVDNTNSSEKGLVFFPAYLRQAGYQTAFIGKWHMGDNVDSPRPGFDKWVSFAGQGSYWPTGELSPAELAAGKVNMINVDGHHVPQRGYITDELSDYAMHWLETERDPTKPFFLYLSHKAVHSDPLPAPRYAHQYDSTNFKLPDSSANTPENYRGKPMWVYNQRNTWHGIDFFYNSDETMTEYLRNYYATLSAVDESLGKIVAYLKKHRLEDKTMIVFTSDNGFLIGDHGLIDKRNAYEGSVRVPLLVWAPGMVPAGDTNPGRIRNLDFAPTFLDVAHVARPPQFEGTSALSLMTGATKPADWKPGDFVYEYYWDWQFPMTPTTFAIERGRTKYIQYYGVYDTEELYDLAADPDEMHNLIEDPAYLDQKMTLRLALFDQLSNSHGVHAIPFTARTSRGSVRRNRYGTDAAPFPDQWLVLPNQLDRIDDMLPDEPAKEQAHARGQAFYPYPVPGKAPP